jgi:hypothetical protein
LQICKAQVKFAYQRKRGKSVPGNVTCEFCAVVNPAGQENCIACGAPLPRIKPIVPAMQPKDPAEMFKLTPTRPAASQDFANRYLGGGQGAHLADKAQQLVSVVWRTAGEVIAIAVSGFIIGMAGGGTGLWFLGLAGAGCLGLFVGLAVKPLLFAALSAPLGTIVGLGIGFVLRTLGVGPACIVVAASLLGIAAALIGGRIDLLTSRGCYALLRPFLGAIGGFIFGLLGVLVGGGIKALVSLFAG